MRDKNINIAASKYITSKYDEIDIPQKVEINEYNPTPKRNDPVPAPANLDIDQVNTGLSDKDGTPSAMNLSINWSTPVESILDSNGDTRSITYRFLSHFEIQHNITSDLGGNNRFVNIQNIPGWYDYF